MKKTRILSLALAVVMSVSVVPALAQTDKDADVAKTSATQTKSVETKETEKDTKKSEKVSPGKIYDVLQQQANNSLDTMEEIYYDANDDVADVVQSASKAYFDVLDETMSALGLIADIDEDNSIPYYRGATEVAPRWDHDLDGQAISIRNTDQSISVRYVSGGTLRKDVLANNNIKIDDETLAKKLTNSSDLYVINGTYFVEIFFNRNTNRLTVSYGTKEGANDLGGVDLVYRGENSIFLQQFYPVERQRDLDFDKPFLATRILQQENRVRLSQEYIEGAKLGSIRLQGGYPSWNAFSFKDYTYDFDLKEGNFKVFDENNKLFLNS